MKKVILSLIVCACSFSLMATDNGCPSKKPCCEKKADCPAKKGECDKGKNGCPLEKKDGKGGCPMEKKK